MIDSCSNISAVSSSYLDDSLASTASANSVYVTTTSPAISWSNAYNTNSLNTGYSTSIDSSYFNSYFDDKLQLLISVLKESEIEELFDKFIERNDDSDDIIKILKSVISQRHFSEDFLLKYYIYIDERTVKTQHSADIKSQEYSRLALLIEGQK